MRGEQKGFTLVEVMVSLTIMSFIVLSIYTIVDSNIKIKDRVLADDQEFIQVQTALNRLNMDLSQLYSPRYFAEVYSNKNQNNQDETNDDYSTSPQKFKGSDNYPVQSVKFHPIPSFKTPDATTLIFLSTSNKRKIYGQKQSKFNWVKYSLESDDSDEDNEEKKEGEVLVRRVINEDVFNGENSWDKVKGQPILYGVKKLKFSFWDKKKERWIDNADQLSNQDQYSIRGVKVELEWIDHNGVSQETFRIFRPLWPFFDVAEDQKELELARKGKEKNDKNKDDDENQN